MGDSYEPYLQTSDIQDLADPRLGSFLSSGFYGKVFLKIQFDKRLKIVVATLSLKN